MPELARRLSPVALAIAIGLTLSTSGARAEYFTNPEPERSNDASREASAGAFTSFARTFDALSTAERSGEAGGMREGISAAIDALQGARERFLSLADQDDPGRPLPIDRLSDDRRGFLASETTRLRPEIQRLNVEMGELPRTAGEAFRLTAASLDRTLAAMGVFRDEPSLDNYRALYNQMWSSIALGEVCSALFRLNR
jgi:hypothetical protein